MISEMICRCSEKFDDECVLKLRKTNGKSRITPIDFLLMTNTIDEKLSFLFFLEKKIDFLCLDANSMPEEFSSINKDLFRLNNERY